jgi:methylated-DNA-[protein]-cysteine S-methyltransferase
MIEYDVVDSPLGELLATSEDGFITGLYFDAHKGGPERSADWARRPSSFNALREELDAYFDGRLTEFSTPIRLRGTEFQESVWRLLTQIRHGETRSYGDLARALGRPSASRAVGAAVGRNPISIVVPCHRVLGSSGAITGFAGGVDRKAKLLALERRLPSLI